LEDLTWLAADLGIPTADGRISDSIATAINDFKPFHEGESAELIEDWRTAWLALHEGARLAKESGRQGEGAHSGGSSRVVSGLAEITNSIICDGSQQPEAANGCPVLLESRDHPP